MIRNSVGALYKSRRTSYCGDCRSYHNVVELVHVDIVFINCHQRPTSSTDCCCCCCCSRPDNYGDIRCLPASTRTGSGGTRGTGPAPTGHAGNNRSLQHFAGRSAVQQQTRFLHFHASNDVELSMRQRALASERFDA